MTPETRTKTSTGEHRNPQREISSGIIIFRRGAEGVRFLLLYHGGEYWNFPKGKIEVEERSREAALRETEEETGLSSRDLQLVRSFKAYERFTFYRNRKKIFKLVILYLAETKKHRIRISKEHAGYGWFSYTEAKKLLARYKENLVIIRDAHSFLSKQDRPQGKRSRRRQRRNKKSAS